MINNHIKEAYKVLDGEVLSRELAIKLSNIDDIDLMDLLSLANKVKEKFKKLFG